MGVTSKDTKLIHANLEINVLDVRDFNERVVDAYEHGTAEEELEADLNLARSLIPAGTGALRNFAYIAPEIPEFITERCVGCMDCVVECPDTAILAKVVTKDELENYSSKIDDEAEREHFRRQWAQTTKYWKSYEKKNQEPGYFGIFIDPTKCKGCAECVEVCGDTQALKMVDKTQDSMPVYAKEFDRFRSLPHTPQRYVNERILADMMLADKSLLYVGGAGSCAGCGEATAIRMMLAATGFVYDQENIGIVASTGCNTVYSSTYPYNPFMVPWTNSLFENGPADAMGVRLKWDQMGWEKKRLWVIGGDGAMLDIGFQSLSRMLAAGMDIKVLVLDTQVYSNTGGQASTASFMGQDADMARVGKKRGGKSERRKELAQICIMHPDVYVAQTTCAHVNHFYKAIIDANEYEGPAVISVFTTCQPEHGVADHLAGHQAKLAADSRAFPLLIHDPRKGDKLSDRIDLKGNPAVKDDWYVHPKSGEVIDFVHFARTEGRFGKHFDKDGNPDAVLLAAQEDRLKNWHLLQELAGLR